MKRLFIIVALLVIVSACGRSVKDRRNDEGANQSAYFLEVLDVHLGTYDTKIDSVVFVGTEGDLRLYDVYHHQKKHPVNVAGVTIYPEQVFHTKYNPTTGQVTAFQRNDHGWVNN